MGNVMGNRAGGSTQSSSLRGDVGKHRDKVVSALEAGVELMV